MNRNQTVPDVKRKKFIRVRICFFLSAIHENQMFSTRCRKISARPLIWYSFCLW